MGAAAADGEAVGNASAATGEELGVGLGDGEGFADGLADTAGTGDVEAFAAGASLMTISVSKDFVVGRWQILSLQTWYDTLAAIFCGPAGASALARTGRVKLTVPS